ncbi:uncharacterized protein LOC110669723 [Hevea brasiliensis]|uniref:uncharacterized protein LOC110669723 n=1 Tax=Hevea brasiliensis TaxID=3981 RepID=UPI0025CE79E4|nr:uncharacterized protein LOC110669723 [Hevea brasiliensis]
MEQIHDNCIKSKGKMGFINDKYNMPDPNSENYEEWQKVDNMVISWILHALSKDLAEVFLYATTSYELWEEINERFGRSNGPLMYQLMKQISTFFQGNNSLVVYYTKLKRLWDEYTCSAHECVCGASKLFVEIENKHKVMQFLMGLNDAYDHVRNQILIMEPLPNVNKAFSLVTRVEKHKDVYNSNEDFGNSAMVVKTQDYSRDVKGGKQQYKKKEDRVCTYCKATGHVKETCFKLNGYPDWFSEYKQKKGKGKMNVVAQISETPLNYDGGHVPQKTDWNVKMIIQEMMKYMKAHGQGLLALMARIWCVNYTGFAGMSSNYYSYDCNDNDLGEWIIDTRATTHMCNNLDLFSTHKKLANSNYVTLPNGTNKTVSHIGTIILHPKLKLTNDLVTKEVLATGRMHKGLYRLNKKSFSFSIPSCSNSCKPQFSVSQQRLSFAKSKISTEDIFELVHIDLWGPYSVPSISSAKCVVTLVDDFSRATWTYLPHDKTTVFVVIKEFIAMKSKFEERAFKCVFLGYVHGIKAYKLYDIQHNKVIVSRDVVFHETCFPYHSIKDTFVPSSIVLPNPVFPLEVISSPSPNNYDHTSSAHTHAPMPLPPSQHIVDAPSLVANPSSTSHIFLVILMFLSLLEKYKANNQTRLAK